MPTRRTPTERRARPALPDALQFMQLLWAVIHGVDRTSKQMTRDIGVTGPQRLVLRVLGLFPGLSAGGLAEFLHLHPSTLTGILRRLVRQRLVARVRHPHDRRLAVLRLTGRGARANAVRGGTVESAITVTLGEVTARERVAAMRVLAHLARHLDQPGSPRRDGRPHARRKHHA